MTDHTARSESWKTLAQWAASKHPDGDCILELRARVERLEHKQRDSEAALQVEPAPTTPAGQGELVGIVAEAIRLAGFSGPYEPVQAGILAVADWLVWKGYVHAADLLRREVGR